MQYQGGENSVLPVTINSTDSYKSCCKYEMKMVDKI